MRPSIGRIVIVSDGKLFNGATEHAAIVTRVSGTNDPADMLGSSVCINATVFPDLSETYCAGSISLFETREQALASGNSYVAWWPERV